MDPEDVQAKFWRAETKRSAKFNVGAASIISCYCFYYLWGMLNVGYNSIPLICAGLSTLLQCCGIAWQVYMVRTPSHFSGGMLWRTMTMFFVLEVVLFALTRLDLQFFMYEKIPNLENYLGKAPGVASRTQCESEDDCIIHQARMFDFEGFATTQCIQCLVSYVVLFVLPAWYGAVFAFLSTTGYAILVAVIRRTLIPMLFVSDSPRTYSPPVLSSDAALMFAIAGCAVVGKWVTEHSQLKVFEMLDAQRIEVVTEKVLRCQAEFVKEDMLAKINMGDRHSTLVESSLEDKTSAHSTTVQNSCAAQSAPAILTASGISCSDTCQLMQAGGDCLPADALSWTVDSKQPQPLSSLTLGDRILCYDNLAKTLTHAEVVGLQDSVNPDWVKVELADGSTLDMTADHPVAVQPLRGACVNTLKATNPGVVRAGDLKAGKDAVMMLKIVWTPVSKVQSPSREQEDGNATGKKWVSISVEQSERHEIFVAAASKEGVHGDLMAVGCSDRLLGSAQEWSRNTFLDIPMPKGAEMQRCNSDPLPFVSSTAQTCGTSSIYSQKKTKTKTVSESTSRSSKSASETSSYTSSIASFVSGDHKIRTHVKVGPPIKPDSGSLARLTDTIKSHIEGSPSLGSRNHTASECTRPCTFHFQSVYHGRPPCKAGGLCEYCHDTSHQSKWRSKLRKHCPRVIQHL